MRFHVGKLITAVGLRIKTLDLLLKYVPTVLQHYRANIVWHNRYTIYIVYHNTIHKHHSVCNTNIGAINNKDGLCYSMSSPFNFQLWSLATPLYYVTVTVLHLITIPLM